MLSNRVIAVLTVAGLLLPLLVVLTKRADDALDLSPLTCDQLILDINQRDNVSRLPSDPLLVLGDRTARHWPATLSQLGDQPVVVRGYAGLTPALAGECAPRLVGHYRPQQVLLFLEAGDQNKLETELIEELLTLRQRMDAVGVHAPLLVVSVLQTPSRNNPRIARLNDAVAEAAARAPEITFINANPLLLRPDGTPDPRAFWPDGDTLSADRYGGLAALIGARIAELRSS